ncbi:hypothetical protein DM01DRAFT_1334654 [Hesseltinella vesiculosa]|uniref:Uncharacterized protein n=1 Tax=Hesseltinella vesiculosa TaxID=101127 RepID=A0A1X2GKK3_9FUNG|nr:hypothetical protein DM01DRAFT_1334654 [Hesseltinella vesiculosa]
MAHFERQIQQLRHAWKKHPPTIVPKPTKQYLLNLEKQDPDHPYVKQAADPIFAMIHSTERMCCITRKRYPSDFLVRFELGLDPKTSVAWAYPTVDHTNRHDRKGHGYYALLDKSILSIVEKKPRKMFQGQGQYAEGMTEHVQQLLMTMLLEDKKKFTPPMALGDYQCVILMKPDIPNLPAAPCYEVDGPAWKPLHDCLQHMYPAHDWLGVPKSITTVDLAIRLWRFNRLVQS